MKDINEWTLEELKALPHRKWDGDIGQFDSLVIIPTDQLHDSDYRCMDFVAVVGGEPKCLLSGCSDVIHVNGIGGYGDNWLEKYGTVPKLIAPIGWSIDCLKTSGLLRLFSGKKLTCGDALSSFEIYSNETK